MGGRESGRYCSAAVCGRFTLTRSAAEVAEHFGLDAVPDAEPRFNAAPTQPVAAIRWSRTGGGRILELRYWGLVPRWAKDASGAARMINARAETAAEKPAYRHALRQRRCLVPMDGFYEWKAHPTRKRPHHVALEQGELFAVAGLYEHWRGPDGGEIQSVTLLTQAACEGLRGLHHRMPVVVDATSYAAWLDPECEDGEDALGRIGHATGERLKARPVSYRVNDVRHDDAACLGPPDEVQLSFLDPEEF